MLKDVKNAPKLEIYQSLPPEDDGFDWYDNKLDSDGSDGSDWDPFLGWGINSPRAVSTGL